MKSIVKPGVVVLMCIVFTHSSYAADDCGNLPLCPGYGDDVPGVNCCLQVPFDGGITLMLAAGGIGMGVRAMRKKKKSN